MVYTLLKFLLGTSHNVFVFLFTITSRFVFLIKNKLNPLGNKLSVV